MEGENSRCCSWHWLKAGEADGLEQQAGGHLHHEGGEQLLQGLGPRVTACRASIFLPEWQLQLQTLAG